MAGENVKNYMWVSVCVCVCVCVKLKPKNTFQYYLNKLSNLNVIDFHK